MDVFNLIFLFPMATLVFKCIHANGNVYDFAIMSMASINIYSVFSCFMFSTLYQEYEMDNLIEMYRRRMTQLHKNAHAKINITNAVIAA